MQVVADDLADQRLVVAARERAEDIQIGGDGLAAVGDERPLIAQQSLLLGGAQAIQLRQ